MMNLYYSFLCTLLMMCTNVHSQEVYNYGNEVSGLTLYSDGTYKIVSLNPLMAKMSDDLPDLSVDIPDVVWTEGEYIQVQDTLYCTDNDSIKNCSFVKNETGDIYKMIDWKGFKLSDDKANRKKIAYSNNEIHFVEAHIMFADHPLFYLISHIGEIDGKRVVLEAYVWKDGVKRQVVKYDAQKKMQVPVDRVLSK